MRQLRPRRAASRAAAVIGVCVLATACGSAKAGSSASGAGTSSPAAAACASVSAPSSSAHVVTLSSADNGKAICVKVGSGVLVYLHGTAAHKWSPIASSTTALAPRANGRMMLALGVTGGYFVAVRPGTATLTSSRSACGPVAQPTGPATSGSSHCTSIGTVYHVTLVISG